MKNSYIPMFRMCVLFLFQFIAVSAYSQVHEQDSLALLSLYQSTGGENWENNSGWQQGPVSTWFGITVEGNRVIKVELGANGLAGELPTQLGDLSALRVLNLFGNSLTGEILPEIGNLELLEELILSKNEFTGTIPDEITQLDSLRELVLISNYDMTGPIPDLGPLQNLEELYLDNIRVDGPFPETFLRLKKLKSLAIRSMGITGEVPPGLLDSLSDLRYIRFSSNQFEGDISKWLKGPSLLESFDIYDNRFTGEIPEGAIDPNSNSISIAKNLLSGLPDFSSAQDKKSFFYIDQNKFGFHELEKALGVETFNPDRLLLGPQKKLLEPDTIVVQPGEQVFIHSGSESDQESYQWYRNNETITGAIERTYEIPEYSDQDAGIYHCVIRHPDFSFDLERSPVTIQSENTTSVAGILHSGFKIYPNPVSDQLYLESEGEIQRVRIHDSSGRLWTETKGNKIPVHTLPRGEYALTVWVDSSMLSGIFIKR